MFVYEPALLMIGSEWYVILQAFVSALIGTTCLAASLAGYFVGPATRVQRVMLFAAALLLIKPDWITDLIWLALLAHCGRDAARRPQCAGRAARLSRGAQTR